ncbi:uncharacterized protein A1O9_07927 [Exophiala aquamarina CBS 119918]|uniref:Uncharacterized protein n=1 Tax=Exophiala aquamarina CBS 119918 TaxID=1182545 RepID=A0A072P923_9EURO|nr:uncharacterized protein A1O9_07927 [Exophiala aquamarina CBS 119918]KEF56346.1 hypothetical protein A1O9_07927 [Exophiala aquamarina CBS 119918]
MINLGLSRISSLLRPLFDVHDPLPWRAIHIAGTNGKGSVASYISTFLAHRGYKVGRFTSPHLVNRWDCIWLNSRVVEKEVFLQVENELRDLSVKEGINASEFEILTAVAFELFTRQGMDFGVVECGLGGRLDATNALRPQDVCVSVLAKVGLDHTEFLGSTLKEIAREKCGIFKRGVPVVVDESNDEVVKDVVKQKLDELDPGTTATPPTTTTTTAECGLWFRLPATQAAVLDSLTIRALGLADHQRQNLSTAYTAYYIAEQQQNPSSSKGPLDPTPIPEPFAQRIRSTIQHLPALIQNAHASIRGRLEWLTLPAHLLPSEPRGKEHFSIRALVDGAHNPQSAAALATHIDRNVRRQRALQGRPLTWVLAMKRGKEIDTILHTLIHDGDNVVACSFGPVDGMPWVESLSAAELADQARALTSGRVEGAPKNGDVAAAIQRAVTLAERGRGHICIAGSLYLVSDVLRLVEEGVGGREDSR